MKRNSRFVLLVCGVVIALLVNGKRNSAASPKPPLRARVFQEKEGLSWQGNEERIAQLVAKKNALDKQAETAATDDRNILLQRSRRVERLIENLKKTHQNMKILVLGGEEDVTNQFPFQAAILDSNFEADYPEGAYFCGASFINSQWIVTAEHCLTQAATPSDLALFAASEDLHQAKRFPVAKFCRHIVASKGDGILMNDIALIKLEHPAANIQSIAQAQPADDAKLSQGGGDALISGWGSVSRGSVVSPRKLLFAKTTIVPSNVCSQYAPYSGLISDGMVCAGPGAPSPCAGDSGGPLVVMKGNTPLLEGITSTGGVCNGAPYTIFTRVSYYRDWIARTMRFEEGCIGK